MKKLALAFMTAFTLIGAPVLSQENGKEPVILINAFIVPDGKEAEAIAFWEKAADFMRTQPGYVSTALHESILPNAQFHLINIAKWESVDAFKNASEALRTSGTIKPVEGVRPTPSLYTVIRTD